MQLCHRLSIPHGSYSRTKIDLKRIADCHYRGVCFDPHIRYREFIQGRPAFIPIDGVEAQIIADAIELGMSLRLTHALVVTHCEQNDMLPFSSAAVSSIMKKLEPRRLKVGKRKQGHTSKDLDWSKLRLAWVTQLLIRFGKLDSVNNSEGNIPNHFNADRLTKLVPEQIVWWDESHWKCVIGGQGVNSQKVSPIQNRPT